MQFSLDRFFEMIEERFGRWASTGILAIFAITIPAILVAMAWGLAIWPVLTTVWPVITQASFPFTRAELFTFFYFTVVPALSFGLSYWFFMRRQWVKTSGRQIDFMEKLVETVKQLPCMKIAEKPDSDKTDHPPGATS